MKINSRVLIMREAVVKLVNMLSQKDVKVTQRGSRAFVQYHPRTLEPVRVNIPYMPDDASDELLDAIQGFLDHEVAHILFTDATVIVKANVAKVGRLHNIIEDSFIEKKMADHFSGSGLNLRNVGHFFLKEYTDKKIKEKPKQVNGILIVPAIRAWAGQQVYIEYMKDKWTLIQPLVDALGADIGDLVSAVASSRDGLNVALEIKRRLDAAKDARAKAAGEGAGKSMGDEGEEGEESKEGESGEESKDGKPGESGKSKEKSKPGKEKDDSEDEPGEGGDDSEEGEMDLNGNDDVDLGDEAEEGGGESSEGEGDKGDKEGDDKGEKSEGEGKKGEEEEEGEKSAGDDGDAGDEIADGVVKNTEKGEDQKAKKDSLKGGKSDKKGGATSEGHPGEQAEEPTVPGPTGSEDLDAEMGADYDDAIAEAISRKSETEGADSDYLVYTKDLDKIEVLDPRDVSDATIKEMQDGVDHMVGAMQKGLERAIAAKSAATWTGGHRQGRMHSSALTRLNFGDDRVFRRKHINLTKNVAVELVCDLSGSMHGIKVKTASYAAYGLSAVLERIGIQHEVIGFTTGHIDIEDVAIRDKAAPMTVGIRYARNESIYMPIIKGWGERVTSEVKKRFAALTELDDMRENIDGESIAIAAMRLHQRKEVRKIMIVLSDGQPACGGLSPRLRAHLKATVGEVVKMGVTVVGIGIRSEAVKEFYPKCVVIENVADLPEVVMTQLRQLLTE